MCCGMTWAGEGLRLSKVTAGEAAMNLSQVSVGLSFPSAQ